MCTRRAFPGGRGRPAAAFIFDLRLPKYCPGPAARANRGRWRRTVAGGDGGRLISRSQYTAQEEKKGGIKRGEKESESIITDLTDGRMDGRDEDGRGRRSARACVI